MEIGALPVKNSIIIFCFLKYYISLKIQFSILLFSRQNMHYLTLISGLVVCRLSLIANKQECVKKDILLFQFRKFGKVDGKAEIEEKIDGNSELLPPLRPLSRLQTSLCDHYIIGGSGVAESSRKGCVCVIALPCVQEYHFLADWSDFIGKIVKPFSFTVLFNFVRQPLRLLEQQRYSLMSGSFARDCATG